MPDPQPNGDFEWVQEPWGRALRSLRLPAPHLFTSRDLALRGNPAEWAAVASSLRVAPGRLLLVKQVHRTGVAVARRGANPTARQEGYTGLGDADIVLTDDPSVAIGVRVADCTPVLLYDAAKQVVGAVHAGWRGTAADASGAAVAALTREFGSDPGDVVAAIGPCLGACCGEVGPEVVDAFRLGGACDAEITAWFVPGQADRSFLNLERANRDQLARAGVERSRILVSGLCTKTHRDRLHSYRADREATGRMLAAIRLPAR